MSKRTRIATRVFILGMDGAGNWNEEASTPNMDRIIKQAGVMTQHAQTELPTISAQCWGSMLHGVTPDRHGVNNDIAAETPFPKNSPYPSFFRVAREADAAMKLASFTAWMPINFGLVEDGLDIYKASANDEELTRLAIQYLREVDDIDIFYFAIDLPDAAGHRYGYSTAEHVESIGAADEMFGKVLNAIEARGWLEDSLILFVTDHGGGGAVATGHGSDHPMDQTIFWGCAGPGVNRSARLDGLTFKDTAAVVATALGLPIPAAWDARLPEDLFVREVIL